jgi:hypothetical protein
VRGGKFSDEAVILVADPVAPIPNKELSEIDDVAPWSLSKRLLPFIVKDPFHVLPYSTAAGEIEVITGAAFTVNETASEGEDTEPATFVVIVTLYVPATDDIEDGTAIVSLPAFTIVAAAVALELKVTRALAPAMPSESKWLPVRVSNTDWDGPAIGMLLGLNVFKTGVAATINGVLQTSVVVVEPTAIVTATV